MANPFDQFDAPAPGTPGVNPFDQFDAPAKQSDDKASPSIAADAAKGFGSGLLQGAVELPQTPITLKRAAEGPIDWLVRRGGNVVREALGYEPISDAEFDRRQGLVDQNLPMNIDKAVNDAQDAGRSFMNDKVYYHPQTTAGKYADTVGQFIPGALAGGAAAPGLSMIDRARNLAADAVIPALASEGAGQLTAGTAYEPFARAAGAIGGNLASATGGFGVNRNAADRMTAEAANGITPEQFKAAQELQIKAATIGVPLTGPEALQHVTGGATRLPALMRVAENAPRGDGTLNRFFAGRPQQVSNGMRAVLDSVAPQDANPITLGQRASELAQGAIDDVRVGINRQTRPLYQAAESQIVDNPAFARATADPAFVSSLKRLRADPVLGPKYEGLPDNSIGVIDAVTKDMQARGQTLGNAAVKGFNPEKASDFTTGAANARTIARDPSQGGSQAYADALRQQATERTAKLDPLEQGTLGRLASAGTTQQAYDAILPSRPLAGGRDEVVDAVLRAIGTEGGTPVIAPLVRQGLADQLDQSTGRLQSGANLYGGANFAKAVAGTQAQQDNLRGVLGALPSGAKAAPAMDDALEVLRATGARLPVGSPTAPNTQITNELSAPNALQSALGGLRSGGLSFLQQAGDAARRAQLGRGVNDLAGIFTAPDSVRQIQSIAAQAGRDPIIQAILRSAVQASAENGQ